MAEVNFVTPGDVSAAVLNPSSMTANHRWMVMLGYALGYYETKHFMERETNKAFMHIPQGYLTGPLCDSLWVGLAFAPERTMRVDVGEQTYWQGILGIPPQAYNFGVDIFVLKPSLAVKMNDELSVGAAFRYAYGRVYDRNNYFSATEEGTDYGWEVSATWNVSDSVRLAALYASALHALEGYDIRQSSKLGCDWKASDDWLLGLSFQNDGDIGNTRHRSLGIGAKYYVSDTLRVMAGYTIESYFARLIGRNFHTVSMGIGKTFDSGTDLSLGLAFNAPHHAYSSSEYTLNFSLGKSF